jgi:PHS family inorganic phosphate transporter-like MFS transporter
LALGYRLTIPETPRFTFDVEKDFSKAVKDTGTVLAMNKAAEQHVHSGSRSSDETFDDVSMPNAITPGKLPKPVRPNPATKTETASSWADFKGHFGQWRNLRVLLGCCITWFALDVAFYGINLNQSVVLEAIGYAPRNAPAYDTLFSLALGNLLINLMGTGNQRNRGPLNTYPA